MKKLLALFVMLAVLGLCTPSFGYVLVYKLMISGKALDLDEQGLGAGKMKGFLVLEIIGVDGGTDVGDAGVVLYDRVPGPKAYQAIEVSSLISVVMTDDDDFVAFSIVDDATGYRANLTGKTKITAVGLDEKVRIPNTLTGGILMGEASDPGSFFDMSDLVGSANVTATLHKKLTKLANQEEIDVEGVVVDEIVSVLEDKGFENIDAP